MSVLEDVPPAAVAERPWSWRVLDVARTNATLVAIIAVAFLARLAWVLKVDASGIVTPMGLGDQYSYYYYGREMARGNGYVSYTTGRPTAYYPVGYPLLLAVLFWFVDNTPLPDHFLFAAQFLNVLVSTATVGLTFVVGRALFGRRAALIAATIVAVFPNLVFQVASLQLETMFTFWCMAALAVLVTHDWSGGVPSTRRLLVFGGVLGVSVLVRPFSIWFVLAVLLAALVARAGWGRAASAALIPLGVIVALSVPWTVRNAISLDAFVPTSTNTGDTLCLDRVEGANGGFRWSDHEGCADPSLPEVERSSISTRKAIRFVLDDPVREVVQIGRRARFIFGSDHDGIEAASLVGHGPSVSPSMASRLEDLSDVYFEIVLVLAAGGLVVAVARRPLRPETVLVLVSLASLAAVPLLLWGSPRFHLPFSPLLAVLAGGALGLFVDAATGVTRPRPAQRPAPG